MGLFGYTVSMNQSSNEAPGLNLPPMGGEQLPLPGPEDKQGVQSSEQAPAAPEQAPKTGTVPPPTSQPIQLPKSINTTKPTNQDDVIATTKNNDLKIIEDSDLIEKEWVDKAKEIVERNRDDPYKQSEQITEVRAEYMKKRYNKIIKTNK